jgi:hypothetical protein
VIGHVIVAVIVIVIGHVIVAVHLIGNDTVVVIGSRHGSGHR